VWCRDLFNARPWIPGERWWPAGRYDQLLLSVLIPLGIVIFGFWGRLRDLPHPALFISVFVFLPLPHYFTRVNNDYTQTLRTWLALLAIVMIFRTEARIKNE
jgi:hypothetical protein